MGCGKSSVKEPKIAELDNKGESKNEEISVKEV